MFAKLLTRFTKLKERKKKDKTKTKSLKRQNSREEQDSSYEIVRWEDEHVELNLGRRSRHIKTLHVRQCWRLVSLPESLGRLAALQQLDIIDCPALKSLPESLGSLTALTRLEISGCDNLSHLLHSFGNLAALQELVFCSCPALAKLPESFGNLVALQQLTVIGCYNLSHLPHSFGNLAALQKLRISSGGLQTLPASFGNLACLQQLELAAGALHRLPESCSGLTGLQELVLECPGLTRLPKALTRLTTLRRVQVVNNKQLLQRLRRGEGVAAHVEVVEVAPVVVLAAPTRVWFAGDPPCLPEEVVVRLLDEAFGGITAASLGRDSLLKGFVRHLVATEGAQEALKAVAKLPSGIRRAAVEFGIGYLAAMPKLKSWGEQRRVAKVRAFAQAVQVWVSDGVHAADGRDARRQVLRKHLLKSSH